MTDSDILAGLDAELASFPPTSATARLCAGLLSQVPRAPTVQPFASLDEAAATLHDDWAEPTMARARELASTAAVKEVRFAAKSIDTGDTGLTILTGVRSAFALFTGGSVGAVDEPQQKADAALKALGIAFIAHRLFDGSVDDRLKQLRTVPAGRCLLLFYGAAEVALPFVEQVKSSEGRFVQQLLEEHSGAIADKLAGAVGAAGVAQAQEVLAQLTGTLDKIAVGTAEHVEPLAQSIQGYLPGPLRAAGGSLTDLAAIGADTLPVYQYLVARLAAEAALFRAIRELEPERLPSRKPKSLTASDGADPWFDDTPEDRQGVAGKGAAQAFAATWERALGPKPEPVSTAPRSPFARAAAPVVEPVTPEPSEPAAQQPALVPPPEPGPQDQPIDGVFVRRGGGGALTWVVFTPDGQFSNAPPVSAAPVDWVAHGAAGHLLGSYTRVGDLLTIVIAGQASESTVEVQTGALVIDGIRVDRADHDLSGTALEGTWRPRDGSGARMRFTADGWIYAGRGSGELPDGRYELGKATVALHWNDAGIDIRSMYTDRSPVSETPSVLCIGGDVYDLE